ncbi:MAG: hypothetical protein HC769_19490 [Cyanobacteria bacterium CRU_2_1]|nr:hypothetical protein [Cyanobacteria bacterium RU_5_0]NJR60811.1 hypothetical protein [Cyanobacteria bacterium CRU_2_1]
MTTDRDCQQQATQGSPILNHRRLFYYPSIAVHDSSVSSTYIQGAQFI